MVRIIILYLRFMCNKNFFDFLKDNAYPADELMPLSCKGRYRGSEPNRGDIDSTLGK